jgi:clan AA aspartic protease (TIGR02281 family)
MRRALGFVLGVLVGQWLAFTGLAAPSDFHALGMRAWERQDFVEAVRVWSQAVAAHPDSPHFHYLRGTALSRLGFVHSAADAYRLSLALAPPPTLKRLASQELSRLRERRDERRDPGSAVPVELGNGVWTVSVEINGVYRGRFLVDTGSSVTILSPAVADLLGLQAADVEGIALQTLAGSTTGRNVSVRSLRVGDMEVHDAAAVVHDPGSGLDGILGGSFLNRYRLMLDPDRKLLHLNHPTSE